MEEIPHRASNTKRGNLCILLGNAFSIQFCVNQFTRYGSLPRLPGEYPDRCKLWRFWANTSFRNSDTARRRKKYFKRSPLWGNSRVLRIIYGWFSGNVSKFKLEECTLCLIGFKTIFKKYIYFCAMKFDLIRHKYKNSNYLDSVRLWYSQFGE